MIISMVVHPTNLGIEYNYEDTQILASCGHIFYEHSPLEVAGFEFSKLQNIFSL